MNKKRMFAVIVILVFLVVLPMVWKVEIASGRVVDSDGQPMGNAVVRIKGTDVSTLTDAEGHFTLSGFQPDFRVRITAWQDGYYIAGTDAWPWDATLDFTLTTHNVVDYQDYEWATPAVKSRTSLEEFATQISLDLAAGLSVDRAFLPLADQLTLGCRDCHGEFVYDQWATSAHASGAQNIRFLTIYNGTDVAGNKSPVTRLGYSRDYGSFPLPPDTALPYYGPGFKLDSPDASGNCATCHLPTAALEKPYETDPNLITGVNAQGSHCDFCHKIAGITLDPSTGQPFENMPGILSIELLRPATDQQLFLGPFDDVDAGSDTYLPLMSQSEICAPCHTASFWGVPIYQSFAEWQASPYSSEGKSCQNCHMRPDGVTTNFAPSRGGIERDSRTIPTHTFPGADDEELLKNTAEITATVQREGEQLIVDIDITNTDAGHHIPTGSPMRQIFLVVTATDAEGQLLALESGSRLPDWSGDLSGLPGIYFAKILEQQWTGISPTVAYWTPTFIVEDSRLPARATQKSSYTFVAPGNGRITINAQLIFRRAYAELVQQKGWDTHDILMESLDVVVP